MIIDSEQLRTGVNLCKKNSKRLATHAQLLLLNPNADGKVIYSVWSLAVEELGKSCILQDHLNDGDFEISPEIFRGQHQKKFQRGIQELQKSGSLPEMGLEAVVPTNSSADSVVLSEECDTVSVPARLTGRFTDITHGAALPLSHQLRNVNLYVDFKDNHWVEPMTLLQKTNVHFFWDFRRDVLEVLINALLQHLDESRSI